MSMYSDQNPFVSGLDLQNAMVPGLIQKSLLVPSQGSVLAQEASTLGWPVGYWPQRIVVQDGENTWHGDLIAFDEHEGVARYQVEGLPEIHVIND